MHIPFAQQGSTSNVTTEYGETEKEKLARQQQLCKLHYQCEVGTFAIRYETTYRQFKC